MNREIPLDDAEALVNRWRDARATAGRARATVDQTERELYELLGDADVGTLAGDPAVCRVSERRPGIDLVRLREEHPELWQQYPSQRTRTRLKLPRRRAPQTGKDSRS